VNRGREDLNTKQNKYIGEWFWVDGIQDRERGEVWNKGDEY
jgi:hypothetical protein